VKRGQKKEKRQLRGQSKKTYKRLFPAAFAFAHLFLVAAEILALAAALILRLGFRPGLPLPVWKGLGMPLPLPPRTLASLPVRASIRVLRESMLR
jgi:hypothetical protein